MNDPSYGILLCSIAPDIYLLWNIGIQLRAYGLETPVQVALTDCNLPLVSRGDDFCPAYSVEFPRCGSQSRPATSIQHHREGSHDYCIICPSPRLVYRSMRPLPPIIDTSVLVHKISLFVRRMAIMEQIARNLVHFHLLPRFRHLLIYEPTILTTVGFKTTARWLSLTRVTSIFSGRQFHKWSKPKIFKRL